MVYVFVAYAVIWLGVTWYAFNISQQNRRLSRQLEALEAALTAEGRVAAAAAGSKGNVRRA